MTASAAAGAAAAPPGQGSRLDALYAAYRARVASPPDEEVTPGQLSMFMRAGEIRAQYQASDEERLPSEPQWDLDEDEPDDEGGETLESDDEFFDRKYDESGYDFDDGEGSLVDHLREEGFARPVALGFERGSLGRPQIYDGHHRIAVASEEAPDVFLPVEHHT